MPLLVNVQLFPLAVLWIHTGFNANLNPAFYLNADPDPGANIMRIHADPDPGHSLKSQKVEFLHENMFKVGNKSKSYGTYMCLFERQETGFICQFWSISMLLETGSAFPIRTQIQDSQMNPNPCRSRSTQLSPA
jgi:hypothetical protein